MIHFFSTSSLVQTGLREREGGPTVSHADGRSIQSSASPVPHTDFNKPRKKHKRSTRIYHPWSLPNYNQQKTSVGGRNCSFTI